MRIIKKALTLLLIGSLTLLYSNANAQSSKCYQVDLAGIPDILDSINNAFGHRISIRIEDIGTYLTEQLTMHPVHSGLVPPSPYLTGNGSKHVIFRWEPVLGMGEKFRSTALSLQIPNEKKTLPESSLNGAAFLFSPEEFGQLWMYTFCTIIQDHQSILNIIIIDKDVSFDCDPNTPSQRRQNTLAPSLQTRLSPNPFTGQVRIQFDIPDEGITSLQLYDITGQLVDTPLASGFIKGGHHQLDINWEKLSPGTYFSRLVWEGRISTQLVIKTE